MKMKVFVTGATGFLGSYLTRLLLDKGYEVHALRRESSTMAMLEGVYDKVHWHLGDLEGVITLEQELQDIEVIFHCAALISFQPSQLEDMSRINVLGTQELVNLALTNSIPKMIYISSIAALGKTDNTSLITEDTEWDPGQEMTHYGLTKHLGGMEVWRGQAEGLQVAILHPALIMGAGKWDGSGTPAFFSTASMGNPFFPKGATGIVDVRDVAKAALLTLENNLYGERFILSAQNISYREILSMISRSIGRKPPFIPLNRILSAFVWRADALRAWILRKDRIVSKENLRATSTTTRFDNSKLQRLTAFEYTDIKSTINDIGKSYIEDKKSGRSVSILPYKKKENLA